MSAKSPMCRCGHVKNSHYSYQSYVNIWNWPYKAKDKLMKGCTRAPRDNKHLTDDCRCPGFRRRVP